MFEDYFEEQVKYLLNEKTKYIKKELLRRKEEDCEETSIQDRIPFDISNTIKYIKQDEYMRNKKSLKKQHTY